MSPNESQFFVLAHIVRPFRFAIVARHMMPPFDSSEHSGPAVATSRVRNEVIVMAEALLLKNVRPARSARVGPETVASGMD